jgi:hypothetical protein
VRCGRVAIVRFSCDTLWLFLEESSADWFVDPQILDTSLPDQLPGKYGLNPFPL